MKKLILVALVIFAKQINAQCSVNIAGSHTVCAGAADTLTSTGATSYTWMPGGENSPAIIVTPSVTTTYTVIANTGTCTATNTLTVNVHPKPTATFTVQVDTITNNWVIYPTYSYNVANAQWVWSNGTSFYGLYPSNVPIGTFISNTFSVCVILTDSFGCSDPHTVDINNCEFGFICTSCNYSGINVSIENNNITSGLKSSEENDNQIIIYPNPANSKVQVEASQIQEIKLFDLLGNEIIVTKQNGIGVSSLSEGVYFIQVNTNGNISTRKIIIQH
jgi:hypothetical protein